MQKTLVLFYTPAAVLGAFIAFWLLPYSYFNGDHTYWQYPLSDIMNSEIGMRYFVQDSWHFPLLTASNLMYPQGVNIAFTDSIPLLALITKLFWPLLPGDFNYLGWWMLANYMLQAVGAVYLLRGFGKFPAPIYLAAALIACLMPALLIRIAHTALCSHFYILIALGLAVRLINRSTPQKMAYWFVPLCVAAFLTHVYLFAMSFGIFAAAMGQVFLSTPMARKQIILQGGAVIIAMATVYYICGYNGGYGGGQYGFFSMNLLSPFVPQLSSIFGAYKMIDPTGGQYEGFNYMGAGLLGLIILTLCVAQQELGKIIRKYWSLLAICGIFTLLALSNKVYAGDHLIMKLNFLKNEMTNQFRASGRFFWPVSYTIMALCLAALTPYLQIRRLTWVVLAFVILQIGDLDYVRHQQMATLDYNKDLQAMMPEVRPLVEAHKRITIIPTFACAGGEPQIWDNLNIVYLASYKAIPENSAFLARLKIIPDCGREPLDVAERALEPDELLVFLRRALSYDKMISIYPNTKNCLQNERYVFCSEKMPSLGALTSNLKPFVNETPKLDITQTRALHFSADSKDTVYLGKGWSGPESWGTWSDGPSAMLSLPFAAAAAAPKTYKIMLTVGAYLTDKRTHEDLTVKANDKVVKTVEFTTAQNSQVVTLDLPASAVSGSHTLNLELIPSSPASPSSLGLGPDKRMLGISITDLSAEAH